MRGVCSDDRSGLLCSQSISRGDAGKAYAPVAIVVWAKAFYGQPQRPDLEAIVASGLFDECASAVAAVAAGGVEGLHDTNHVALFHSLCLLRNCRSQPGCEAKIRRLAPALAFCLEHDLDWAEQVGMTTGSYAAQICTRPSPKQSHRVGGWHRTDYCRTLFAGCGVFGRDEGGSEFTFTQQHVDVLLDKWSQTVRAVTFNANSKPTADTVQVVELCISDRTKPLLLANPVFIPYLVDALLLDPAHPRAGMKPEHKAWCQTTHAECIAQIAVFLPDGREALRQDPSVRDALRCVAESGLGDEAQHHAESALLALSDTELVKTEGQKHVMLSCACVAHCLCALVFD
jgi:hypothetical protein